MRVTIRKTYDGSLIASSSHRTDSEEIAIQRAVQKRYGRKAVAVEEHDNRGTYAILKPFSNAVMGEPGNQSMGRFNIEADE